MRVFCTQCGKKVRDDMLFCPYCGYPITPVEDGEKEKEDLQSLKSIYGRPEEEQQADAKAEPKTTPEEKTQQAEPQFDKTSETFVPLDAMYTQPDPPQTRSLFSESSDASEDISKPKPVRLTGHSPELNRRPSPQQKPKNPGRPSTYVPRKQVSDVDMEDLFMDDDEELERGKQRKPRRDRNGDYEEPERGDFFYRHMRGIVSLVLMGMLALIVVMWAFSDAGQRSLVSIGAAWRPSAYAEVAKDYYSKGAYTSAARAYAQALDRQEGSYDYAYSAGVCYKEAGDMSSAIAYFKEAIAINPNEANPYLFILSLYQSSQQEIPQDIQTLLQSGYEKTGNENLKIAS